MCTKQDIREELEKNNKSRNENLENKLNKLYANIQNEIVTLREQIEIHLQKTLQHLTSSPETKEKLNNINLLCATRGEQIVNMSSKITRIELNQIQANEKLDSIIEKLDGKYASKKTEYIVNAVLVIFAMAALYYMFSHVGLPIP